ncbi:MAG TPA: alpha/beta hydrolase [Dehalococcoidia bacterium]|nr:alpha/beta hydrolase [Dehalococcoidia bacterium]
MPVADVRGAKINYEVLGAYGPWVALSPGGRRDMSHVRYLAQRIAEQGFRVLVHDRRNCGASDVVLEGNEAEYEVWADDLVDLLGQLDALPAFIGGTSSGCRMSMLTYMRHPEAVRGLLLWRVTGGGFAANRLAHNYYGEFIEAAKRGGMQAACETEHFAERITANPSNREKIMSIPPERFIASFERWAAYFLRGADLPVIGMTDAGLRAIRTPTCIVPGNDLVHPRAVGELAASLIPGAELHVLLKEEHDDIDVSPPEELEAIGEEHAKVYVDFMHKHASVGV